MEELRCSQVSFRELQEHVQGTNWELQVRKVEHQHSGGRFTIKTSYHRYRNFHDQDKTVSWQSYLSNGDLYSRKSDIYWRSAQLQLPLRRHLHYNEINSCVLYGLISSVLQLCLYVLPIWVRPFVECSSTYQLITKKVPYYSQDHYTNVIMSVMASQITNITRSVYSIVYSGADQRKHQSSVSLAFVRGIHRWSVNSPHNGPVTRKMFPFDDVIMTRLLLPKLVRHKISRRDFFPRRSHGAMLVFQM